MCVCLRSEHMVVAAVQSFPLEGRIADGICSYGPGLNTYFENMLGFGSDRPALRTCYAEINLILVWITIDKTHSERPSDGRLQRALNTTKKRGCKRGKLAVTMVTTIARHENEWFSFKPCQSHFRFRHDKQNDG